MANWNLPTPASGYLSFVDEINTKFFDNARMYYVGSINMPQGTMRFNRSGYVFDEYDAASGTWLPRVIGIAGGGTGATTPAGIVANLGLGSMSTQNNNAVNITGGTISGVNFNVSSATGILPLAAGGTGSSLAPGPAGYPLVSDGNVTFFSPGTHIPQLNAYSLVVGVVNDVRLSTNVPLKNADNIWGARQTFNGDVLFSGGSYAWMCTIFKPTDVPVFNMYSGLGGPNRKWTRITTSNGDFYLQSMDDAYNSPSTLFRVSYEGVLYGNGGGFYNILSSSLAGTIPIAALGTNPGSANAGTFLRGDNTWQAVATGGTGTPIPSGLIAMFDSNCPAGWTRVAALDNRVPLGSTSYGGFGGSADHSHGFDVTSNNSGGHSHSFGGSFGGSGSGPINGGGQTGGAIGGGGTADAGGSLSVVGPHVHDFSISGSANVNVTTNVQGDTSGVGDHNHRVAGGTDARSSYPPHMGVIFCRKD